MRYKLAAKNSIESFYISRSNILKNFVDEGRCFHRQSASDLKWPPARQAKACTLYACQVRWGFEPIRCTEYKLQFAQSDLRWSNHSSSLSI